MFERGGFPVVEIDGNGEATRIECILIRFHLFGSCSGLD